MPAIEFGSGFEMDSITAQKTIDQILTESEDLMCAMESIGAMYGIPSSNILCDDIRSVKVTNGNITVPFNKPAISNKDTIIKSISAALDQISTRINDKINGIQQVNIDKGNHDDTLASRIDPSKGKVVMTSTDEDGEPVIVYDSGIIVAAHTPAGRKKAQELRATGNIPSVDPLTKEKPSYFNDDEDITKGIEKPEDEKSAVEYSMSNMCGEDQFFIDVIGKHGDTSSLGYDTFTSQGYSCVRQLGQTFTEAAGSKKINITDIKHMKFDNAHIFKAVECFNKARDDQPIDNPEKINMDAFISNKYYKEAINHLEKQFDCHIALKWIHTPAEYSSAFTQIWPTEYRDKISVSKSKGFQLNGAPLHIFVYETGITELIPRERELFGQGVTSILLHEIFHNIAGAIRYQSGEMITSLNLAINIATATRNPKTRREIVDKFVDTLAVTTKTKLNRVTRRKIANNMIAVISSQSDEALAQQYRDVLEKKEADANTDKEVVDAENRAKKDAVVANITRRLASITKKAKPTAGKKTAAVLSTIGGICLFAVLLAAAPEGSGFWYGFAVGSLSGSLMGSGVGYLTYASEYEKLAKKYKNTKEMEEYYADLLSATYQLPQRFFVSGMTKYTPNEISQGVLDEFVKVEKCAYESFLFSTYPTTSERTHAGVIVAKKLLECKGLNPAVKKYAEWIVENNDNILKTDIDTNYNSHTYDPEEARDVDKHIQALIHNNNIAMTEAAFEYLIDNSIEE